MSDPFQNLAPVNGKSSQAIVRECTHNQTLSAWRNANIAMKDLYICDANYIPTAVDQAGKPITPESRQATMDASGAKPMFHYEGDKLVSNNQDYLKAFTNVQPERLGKAAEDNRPKSLRIVNPVQADPVTEDSKPTAFKENINA